MGLPLFGIFWIFSGKWTAHATSKFIWSLLTLLMGWFGIRFWLKDFGYSQTPKTTGNKPEIVDLFAFPNKNFCPIHAQISLKKSSRKNGCYNPEYPIFWFASGKLLTTSALSGILKKLLAKSKFKDKKILAKSLRSGVPTDLENNPDLFNDLHIKIWGRWKSSSYQKYMKDDKYQREWIFKKMCQILTPFCS